MADDFLDLISSVTGYVQNERIASYNEGVDDMLKAARDWMLLEGVRLVAEPPRPHEGIPDLLNEIREHFLTREDADDRPSKTILDGQRLLKELGGGGGKPVRTFTGKQSSGLSNACEQDEGA